MYAAVAYHQQLPVVYPSMHPQARFVSPLSYSPEASSPVPSADIENQLHTLMADTPTAVEQAAPVEVVVTAPVVVAQQQPVLVKIAPEIYVKPSVADKVSSITASMDVLQQQLDELRVSCGAQKMDAHSSSGDDFALDADEMISVINIHDY